MTDALKLAARLAREIDEREAVMLELLDVALEQGASLRDLATVTGIPRSTLARKLSSPIQDWVKVSDPELAREVDAIRRARLARLHERVEAAQGRVEAFPAMEAEIAEANAIITGLLDVD